MTPKCLGSARSMGGALAATALVGSLLVVAVPAEARSSRHSGTGYGLQGGVNPELALANVYSGIYGARYTYHREQYSFSGCPDPVEASFGYTPACPPRLR